MKKHFFLFLFLGFSNLIFSQFSDSFTDGDFTNNPSWGGNVSRFEVSSNFMLHLNDTTNNTSYLSVVSKAIINASWEFEVNLAFDPSTSNYAKVYLISNQEDLSANPTGYFVKVGGESGAVDDVSLYYQGVASSTKIIDGTNGLASSSPNLKIKVLRDSIGNWELFVDTSGVYFSEGTAFENSITTANFFGVYCKYTSTRSDKFWFDNFVVTGFENTTSSVIFNQNDIVINEIFADPSPSIGLPEYEYIELYNTTSSPINLNDWGIIIGTTEKTLPASIIEADSFVVLIKEDVIDSFPNNIAKIGLSSIVLPNDGGNIILKDKDGYIINSISYTKNWYNNEEKAGGGWSIEQVNPYLFCEGENNWMASKASIGGTPGKRNSVFGLPININSFRITGAFILDTNKVQVNFNKSLASFNVDNTSSFEVNSNIPSTATLASPFFKSIILKFDFLFLKNTTYTLITNGIFDCSGNMLKNSISFGIPDSALENQIVITELLFNPKDDGVDYVEFFNNSNSYFDLSKLRTANFFELGFEHYAENSEIISETTTLFPPQSYLVFTTDSSKVKQQFYCENPYNFIQVENLPPMSNDNGTICLVHQSLNQIIDGFSYSESMHFPLLSSTDGISLERLDISSPSTNVKNWHSAASTSGFGTPTYKNSQKIIAPSNGTLIINPQAFSPNNDGKQDFCNINWNFNDSNLMGSMKVFDSEGRIVKTLFNNELISPSGWTVWSGDSENNTQLNAGIYIIWMQIFSLNGNVMEFKEVVVLSR